LKGFDLAEREEDGSMKSRRCDEEWKSRGHSLRYLARADNLAHRSEGEKVLLEQLPRRVDRVLDLGTGDGRLLAIVLDEHPNAQSVALDFSEPMLEAAGRRFSERTNALLVRHDMRRPLPAQRLGKFDLVISSFAIHHLSHRDKRRIYGEVFQMITPGGTFWNLEHVASPTSALHGRFLTAIGYTRETEDKSNKLLDVETQLSWLRETGFRHVDCYWKWLELPLLGGIKPRR
jgi:ubiquinone/menaquinone biosynthesis C-methylase UbiE